MNDNQALLDQLRGIQTPEVSAIPAMGWWVVAMLVVLLLLLLRYLRKRHKRRGWQREAFQTLALLRQQASNEPVAQSLAGASRLARRVLLVNKPRTQVAALHGEAWLHELDSVCGRSLFSEGYGRLLEHGPYQRSPELLSDDLNGLFDALDELIRSAARGPKIS